MNLTIRFYTTFSKIALALLIFSTANIAYADSKNDKTGQKKGFIESLMSKLDKLKGAKNSEQKGAKKLPPTGCPNLTGQYVCTAITIEQDPNQVGEFGIEQTSSPIIKQASAQKSQPKSLALIEKSAQITELEIHHAVNKNGQEFIFENYKTKDSTTRWNYEFARINDKEEVLFASQERIEKQAAQCSGGMYFSKIIDTQYSPKSEIGMSVARTLQGTACQLDENKNLICIYEAIEFMQSGQTIGGRVIQLCERKK